MAAQGPAKGGVGWAILAIALAVPGFLFYNWWSHLKADQAKAVAAKAHSRVEGGVFQTPSTAARLVNPISGSTTTNAANPAVPGAAAAALPVAGAPGAGKPAGAAPGLAPVPAGSVPGAAGAPAAAVAASSVVANSPFAPAVSTTTITLSRDPMMSPMDLVRIREEEVRRAENEERMRREAEEARRPHPKAKARVVQEKPIEKFIELQGIVATPDGATLAIVNGATVNEGESFSVEGHKAKVKVLRISSSAVTFEYNGKRFKMSVNAE